jgi:hypothetical protein
MHEQNAVDARSASNARPVILSYVASQPTHFSSQFHSTNALAKNARLKRRSVKGESLENQSQIQMKMLP